MRTLASVLMLIGAVILLLTQTYKLGQDTVAKPHMAVACADGRHYEDVWSMMASDKSPTLVLFLGKSAGFRQVVIDGRYVCRGEIISK